MVLFTVPDFLTKFATRINNFINRYSSNPIFWVVLLIGLLAVTYSAITALSKK